MQAQVQHKAGEQGTPGSPVNSAPLKQSRENGPKENAGSPTKINSKQNVLGTPIEIIKGK